METNVREKVDMAFGFWLLAVGFWLLAFGCWHLAVGFYIKGAVLIIALSL